MDEIIDIDSKHKCAHEQCRCQIPTVQKYCSDACAALEELDEVELQCSCEHDPCALH